MGGDRDGNPNVTAKVTKAVSLLSRWMAIDLYIREVDSLRFELSMNRCSDTLSRLAHEILEEAKDENRHESWNQSTNRSQSLPTQLPARAHLPSFAENGESQHPRLDIPGPDHKDGGISQSPTTLRTGNPSLKVSVTSSENSNGSSSSIPSSPSYNSSQPLSQRKFTESQTGKSSFQKLLEPQLPQLAGIAPYRVVLGNVKDKLERSRRRLELLLEDVACDYDPLDYYETADQLLEPLLLCYESLQSCGSGVLADGRLADLIRRVATFGMVLMKLDLRQESGRHAETLDAVTTYLDMGTYSEWDEETNSSMTGGETEALQRLKRFAAECEAQPNKGFKDGAQDSIYGANFSCKISPWLAMGCLSPRAMFDELKKTASSAVSASSSKNDGGSSKTGTNWLMFELLWRDFFRFITKKYSSTKKQLEAAPATACTGALA